MLFVLLLKLSDKVKFDMLYFGSGFFATLHLAHTIYISRSNWVAVCVSDKIDAGPTAPESSRTEYPTANGNTFHTLLV